MSQVCHGHRNLGAAGGYHWPVLQLRGSALCSVSWPALTSCYVAWRIIRQKEIDISESLVHPAAVDMARIVKEDDVTKNTAHIPSYNDFTREHIYDEWY
jgi:hypothetical protein